MAGAGNRPSVGVALSSGGASALAHMGALERLREAGITIDCVAGTSAGSLVGAVLASSQLAEFGEAVRRLTWRQVLRLFNLVWPRSAFLDFGAAMDFARSFMSERFDSLAKPFAAVTVDLMNGDEIVLRCGDVIEAVRASCSIPGVFPPCLRDGRWLADGALVNPLPVNVARDLGADFTIAINVLASNRIQADQFTAACRRPATPRFAARFAALLRREKSADAALAGVVPSVLAEVPHGKSRRLRFFAVLAQASRIVQSKIAEARLRLEPADFLLNVPVGEVGVFEFHRAGEMIDVGRNAAEEALPALAEALAKHPRAERAWQWRRGRRSEPVRILSVASPTATC